MKGGREGGREGERGRERGREREGGREREDEKEKDKDHKHTKKRTQSHSTRVGTLTQMQNTIPWGGRLPGPASHTRGRQSRVSRHRQRTSRHWAWIASV